MSETNVPESPTVIQPTGAEGDQLQPMGAKKQELQLEEIDKAAVVTNAAERRGVEETAAPSGKGMSVTKVPPPLKGILKKTANKDEGPNKSIPEYQNPKYNKLEAYVKKQQELQDLARNAAMKDSDETAEASGTGKKTPQPPLAKKAEEPETNKPGRFAAFKKWMDDLNDGTFESPSSSSSDDADQDFKPTPEDMTKILITMACLDCDKIPSPFRLFHCPRGHLYCHGCGIKRFTTEEANAGATISSDICGHEMEVQDAAGSSSSSPSSSTTTRGVGYGLIPPDFKLEETEVEELIIKNAGKMVCGLHLRESTGNPLFKAVFNNTKWDCPYKKFGCKKNLYGKDMHAHLELCVKKLGIF